MSKSGSRYGRRSNWFKIHCLLQEQHHHHHHHHQGATNIAAAANLLRPNSYLPLFRSPLQGRETRSSESDSGASSADPEDDIRSASALSYRKPSASPSSDRDYFSSSSSKKLPSPASDSECWTRRKTVNAIFHPPPASPASLPSVSPGGGLTTIPRWLPSSNYHQGFGDPSVWKDLWLKGPLAAPAPEQDEPIDLSIRSVKLTSSPKSLNSDDDNNSERELNIVDVGVVDDDNVDGGDDNREPVKPVPLDLTLDRTTNNTTTTDVVTN